ncbi:unnamed protein product [Sphagnum jensenii]
MEEICEGKEYSFPRQEEKVLKLWEELNAFHTQLKRTEGMPEYIFYDGPPFATGLPHYGHILAGTIKDIVTRFQSATGHHVTRRFGWDCHGLPVEFEIDMKLNIKTKQDVLDLGIAKYNDECRSIVMRYSKEWEKTVTRMGRWIDFQNDYKTLDPEFMESVWWVFKQLHLKGLVYKGLKVMPYSTGCKTELSNFEAGLNYKDVSDPAVMVSFPLLDEVDGASMVAWTTTPWTLPSNLCLCVNANLTYAKVCITFTLVLYIHGENDKSPPPVDTTSYEVIGQYKGSDLVGKKYKPLFDYFSALSNVAFKVVADDYVTDDSGTGVVHCAPAFGEDDYRVCLLNNIIQKGPNLPNPVDSDGHFTEEVTDFKGRYVKEADKDIISAIKAMGRLVNSGSIMHSYPFCWRSDTPLLYKVVPSWYVAVEQIKDKLVNNNKKTYWVPDSVKEKRFHNWLENARDWSVSRSRFWGTPLPIWISDDGEEIIVIGSIQELEELSGFKVCAIPVYRLMQFGCLTELNSPSHRVCGLGMWGCSSLGKRLGKAMGLVAKEVKSMTQTQIMDFERAGKAKFAGHELELQDIKVIREFKAPDGVNKEDIDASGDGDVLVVLDLRPDESLLEAGFAREIVNRVQKLRKKAGLEPTDTVEVYYDVLDGVVGSDSSVLQQVFTGQASYMAEAVGGPVLQQQHLPAHAVVLAAEQYKGVAGGSFKITLARPSLSFAQDLLHEICSGNPAHAENLKVVMLSRDPTNLRSELSSNKKVKVVIDGQGEYELEAGKHFHFSVGDHLLQASCRS